METNTQISRKNDTLNSATPSFLTWYYTISPKLILEIWAGYLAATLHYFSVTLLLRTLLSPWHRDSMGYGRGFDFKRYLSIWSLNMVSRGVGFVVRSATILFALIVEAFILAVGMLFLAFWLAAPLVIFVSFFYGFRLLL